MTRERCVNYFEAGEFSSEVLWSLDVLRSVLAKAGVDGCIKGGLIRDYVANFSLGMDLSPNDMDLMISEGVNKVVELLIKEGANISERHNRKKTPTFKVDLPTMGGMLNLDIGILLGRANTYSRKVQFSDLIEDDARLSDFTANSLFLPISSSLNIKNIVDPLGGIRDIKERVVRMVALNTFVRNPECMLRAIVLADRLGGKIETGTAEAISKYASLIKNAPAFVVAQNMKRIIDSTSKEVNLQLMRDLGLSTFLL